MRATRWLAAVCLVATSCSSNGHSVGGSADASAGGVGANAGGGGNTASSSGGSSSGGSNGNDSGACTGTCPIDIATGLKSPAALVVHGSDLYFTLADAIVMKVPVDGGTPERITLVQYGVSGADGLAVDSANAYFTVEGGGTHTGVMKAPLSGGVATPLILDVVQPEGLRITATTAYWTSPATYSLLSVPLAGGTATPVFTETSGSPEYLELDGTSVYWSDHGDFDYSVKKAPLAGGAAVTLASGLPAVLDIAVDGSFVYFTSDKDLMKVPLAGGTPVTLAPNFGADLALDDTRVYGVNPVTGVIVAVDKNGGTITTLATRQKFPAHVAVDATSVYWLDQGSLINPDGALRKIAK